MTFLAWIHCILSRARILWSSIRLNHWPNVSSTTLIREFWPLSFLLLKANSNSRQKSSSQLISIRRSRGRIIFQSSSKYWAETHKGSRQVSVGFVMWNFSLFQEKRPVKWIPTFLKKIESTIEKYNPNPMRPDWEVPVGSFCSEIGIWDRRGRYWIQNNQLTVCFGIWKTGSRLSIKII